MSFREFRDQIKRGVEMAIEKAGLPKVSLEPEEPPRPEFGDLSVNVAFVIANRLGLKPLKVAKMIGEHLEFPPGSLVATFSIHESGYINFKANYSTLAHGSILRAITDENYGSFDIGKRKKAIVEHTSVNPNKALHIGHARNLVLGDSIYRILKFVGYDVQVLNYIDDSGLQVADIIVGFKYAGFPREPPKGVKFDHYCGDHVYVRVNEWYSSRPELLSKQREVLRGMEDGGSEVAKFAREVTKEVLKEQLKTCWRLGAHYDCLNLETHIVEMKLWERLFELLQGKGVVQFEKKGKLAGCWVIKTEEEGEEKVLTRSDGTLTYLAKDIPYAAWKVGIIDDPFRYDVFTLQPDGSPLWSTVSNGGREEHPPFGKADVAVTVIDARQRRLQKLISYTLSRLGEGAEKYLHLSYEVVSLSSRTARELGMAIEEKGFIHMAGRRGLYINTDDVLDAIHAKAYEEAKKRNPEDENWLQDVAEKIAIAALRFDLLKQDLDKMVVFDFSESLNLEGETGPYIQYAHARASNILKKGEEPPSITKEGGTTLTRQAELDLVRLISKMDLYVEEAAKNLSPKVLTRYAYSLATVFNVFYERVPVLHEMDKEKRLARLALVKAFKNVIKITLYLLGIEVPERI